MSINILGIVWFLLVLYSLSKKMSLTILLTVTSIIFQNALFICVGSIRISIFEISALILIMRYILLSHQKILLNKDSISVLLLILTFFFITILSGIIFNGYEIRLYSEYLGLYQIGTEKLSLDLSTLIVLIRFALYWIVYEIISNYVKKSDNKANDRNMINTLRISIYIVCIIGIIQVLTSRGYINGNLLMTVIHDKNMGAASAYYSNYIRLFSSFAEPSYCAPWINAAIWALVYCKNEFNIMERNFLLLLLFVEFVLSASLTGVLAMAVMFLYYMYTNIKKRYFVLALVIVCVGIFIIIATPIGDSVSTFIDEKANSTSGLSRVAYISDCYRVFFETYLLGVGYMKIKSMTLLSSLFAQVGFIGASMFVWVLIKVLSRKNYTNAQKVTKVFFVATLIGGEISCSGLAYLAPFWYGLLLYAMTNYGSLSIVNQNMRGIKNAL